MRAGWHVSHSIALEHLERRSLFAIATFDVSFADPTGPDAQITLGDSYLRNELWFDPDPASRSATVPSNKTDAYNVFIHELGHAFAYNGWRDWTTGALPDNSMSTFDEKIVSSGGNFYFTGAN